MASRNPLGNLFGRSPIGPIQEHMQIATEAAEHLPELIQAAADNDWTRAKEIHKAINAAEKEADKLKRSVRRHLPKSLFLPVPRSDLLGLVTIQDQVANTAKDFSSIVMGRDLRFPDKLLPAVMDLTATCVACCQNALAAIQELDELLEVGFTGLEVKRVEAMLKELDKLERSTDKQQFTLRRKLFRLESELPPVDVMFYYRAMALLGTLADSAESVGDRLQILLAK
ncbi:TIGR00153 family protein [Pseudohalioglobus sediminis]|uniref:TIGR00153 family protein n=1 Tax=Pseudohalioglobus sediminis TaxID=2606449 RepID=A0A5B0WU57_9GAMM|nr:TIGR00153 family protein [Pseudohalioglobus sediminis]KAA1190610.1 TIGR00153 family protein [Pseudohalioglobus sediminis]